VEQIWTVGFATEPLLQIEKRQPAPVLKGDDFAVEDKIDIEATCSLG